MGLPIDIEEILGSSIVEALRRGGLFVASLLLASASAVFALDAAEPIAHLSLFRFDVEPAFYFLAWMAPLASLWAIVYIPVVLFSAYHFFSNEEPAPGMFIRIVTAEAVLILAAVPDWDLERGIALIVLGGCLMALRHLAAMVGNWRRNRFESQLMGLAAENEQRRARLRETHGTEVPGADFNSDDAPQGPH